MALGSKTPQNIITLGWEVHWLVTFGAVAKAAQANGFAAAIVVGNQVVLIINRVATSAYPGDW